MKALKRAGIVIGILVAASAGAQLVRPASTDLPTDPDHAIQATLAAATGLGPVLQRACGDCHSNTLSPAWYTRVTPVSFVMARAALEGRKAVNFAEWSAYSPPQQRALLMASCTAATAGTMPVGAYLRLRPDARLSAGDVAIICGASASAASH
jgi:hypothetical protein